MKRCERLQNSLVGTWHLSKDAAERVCVMVAVHLYHQILSRFCGKLPKDSVLMWYQTHVTTQHPLDSTQPSPLYDELPCTIPQMSMHDPFVYSLQVGPHRFHPEREQERDLRMRPCLVTLHSSSHQAKTKFKHFKMPLKVALFLPFFKQKS